MSAPLLQIQGLTISYATRGVERCVVEGADLSLQAGQCLGLVGESGSGKTQLLLSILGLLPAVAQVRGSIRYRDTELLGQPPVILNRIRGARIAMVFQNPLAALNPYRRIGDQLAEVVRVHRGDSRAAAMSRAIEMLEAVHLSDPARRARQYPHELSGGMRQRAVLAMALMAEPDLILADEPTTALDVTVQAQILELLRELRRTRGITLLLVTHDLGVVAQLADQVAVMQSGRIVEHNDVESLFDTPTHPYTRALLQAAPRLIEPA